MGGFCNSIGIDTTPRVEKNKQVPQETDIMGQPHYLAYINEEEGQLLKDLGGAGIPGPGGIPAYPPASQSGPGANVAPSSSGGSSAARRRRKRRAKAAAAAAAKALADQQKIDAAAAAKTDDKPSGVGAGNTLPDGSTSLGSVSQTGQYAGDGFEWKQNDNTNALTRVYTGANANAGLGTDVKMGGTSDKNTKEAIANISLNEGTAFAGSAASATDGDLLNLFTEGNFGASDSYADQVGAVDYTTSVVYDSTATGAANTALRDAREAAAAAQAEKEAAAAALKAQQEALSLPVGGPGTFAPGALPAAPIEPVTPVSQGEAGRGGPDSAAPGSFTYAPGVDPEMETLLSLYNNYPDTLSYGERLMAQQYQRDKIASGGGEDVVMNASVLPTTQVADSGGFFSNLGSDILDALTFKDPIGEKIADGAANLAVGIPRNLSEGVGGAANYFYNTAPISSTGTGITNPFFFLADEIQKAIMPNQIKEDRILSQDVNRAPSAGVQGGQALASGLGFAADKIEDYLKPGSQGVFTGDTFSDLNFVGADTGQQLRGGDAVSGAINLGAAEGLADTGIDILMSLNPYTRGLSAVVNAGEQLTGLEAGISDQIDNAYVAGQLDNNPMFQKALKAQDGNVDNALAVLKNLSYTADVGGVPAYLATAASGAADAVIPGPGKGITGLAKEAGKRGVVEGGQGAFESYTAISAVNNALGTNYDPTANIAGAATTEALAGSTGAVVSPFVGTDPKSATQRRFIQDSALGNEAAMQQAAGTQGVASFAPGPANQTAVATQPEAMTTAPTVFNPNLSQTAGELAQSNVPTAYDIEQDKVAGLLEAPQGPDSSATSLDVMAAQEIIENQIRETGTISPEVMTNLQAATGLSMNDLSSMATNAATGTLGGQTFPINVGSETPSDLMDQPTGIGGGGNIGVETLPNGDTLLRNNETGRTTVVDKGENLADAIQVFDEVTTPFGAPEIDTTPVSLPPFNIAGAPAQPVLPAGTDTAPVIPSAPKAPNIPDIDVAGLGSLQPDSLPNVDTSSLPQGSDDTTVQLPATTDGDTLPAATGTEVVIGDDTDQSTELGGLEGEILGPEISTKVNPEEDTGVTIDMEATPETETTPEIEEDTVVSLPPVEEETTPKTPVTPPVTVTPKPLIEVDVDEPPEEVEVEVDPPEVDPPIEEPPIVFIPPVTKKDKDGNTITECPEGYVEVQTPDGIMCEKITTTSTTTGRRTYGVGRTATTGLAGNVGRQKPRSRTRTRTSTSTSRVKPTTRKA